MTTTTLTRRWGSAIITESDDPAEFTVRAVGYVGLGLIRADYTAAKRYAQHRTTPWTYTVDVRAVTLPNPINILYLSRLRHLPRIAEYRVIASPGLQYRLLRLAAGLVGATVTTDDA
ncbi:hypothetical protein [Nocardia sp. NPDC046763]|uniref:hypothetical protein n=1 Tax=Nocardia sp. NPDC046763 TaxID=3155256 RepID=UPI0033C03DF2